VDHRNAIELPYILQSSPF